MHVFYAPGENTYAREHRDEHRISNPRRINQFYRMRPAWEPFLMIVYLLAAASEGAIFAAPVGAKPRMPDGGEWPTGWAVDHTGRRGAAGKSKLVSGEKPKHCD